MTRARAYIMSESRGMRNRGKAQYLRDRKPTPSLHFCYPGAAGLRFRQPAVEPAASLSRTTLMMHGAPALVLAQHLGRNLRLKAALWATGRARTSCDANAVPDRSVQSMRVQFSGSVQRSSLNKFHVCAQTFLFEKLRRAKSRPEALRGVMELASPRQQPRSFKWTG